MRFLRLDLKAVGPFTGASLDLSGSGLHLIVGPNEAGKSSALRAISYLLFGFPHEVPEARFVHDYPKLRVGAVLRGPRGEVLEVVRRKRLQESLVSPDEATVIPEARLQEMLGRIERSTFENLLGIDHARLRQGGQQIREGRGEFAGLLFAAGAGLAGLRTAQSQLQKQLGELFLERGQKPRINATCQELNRAKQEFQQRVLPTDEWRKHDEALREASEDGRQLSGRMDGLRLELLRTRRLRDAIAVEARRRRIAEDLEELADSPSLRPGFGDEVRAAFAEKEAAGLIIDRSEERLRQISERLASLPDASAWLADGAAIEALQREWGAVEKAIRDRARIEGFRQEDEHAARGLLRDLRQPVDLSAAESLPLRADEPLAIRALANERSELAARADEARKAIRRYEQQIGRIDGEPIDEPADVEALRRAARLGRKAGDLDLALANSLGKFRTTARELALALARLPDWSGDADQLRDLPVPLETKIGRFEKEYLELDQDEQRLRRDRDRIEAESREIGAQLRALELNLSVPTEADLAGSREARDRQWQAIRRPWIDGESTDQGLRRTQADGLDLAITRSDALADRLRREAEGVARKSDALAKLEQIRTAQAGLDREIARRAAGRRQLSERWDSIASGLGLEGWAPAEVREWLKLREAALQALDRAEEARRDHEEIDSDRRAAIEAVREALRPHDSGAGHPGDSLGALLDHAEAILDRADSMARRRRDRESRRRTAQDEIEVARATLRAAEDGLALVSGQWGTWMERIRLEPGAGPEQAEVFLGKLDQLRETLDKLRGHRSRLAGIARDEADFARHATELASRLLPGWATPPDEGLARELARRLAEAQQDDQKRTDLENEREQEAGRLESARDRAARAEARLQGLADEAGGVDPSDLLGADRRSIEKANLDRQRAEYEGQLREYAAGRGWDDFRRQLETADPDVLALRIEHLEGQLVALQEELNRANQAIGAEEAELARMRGGDEAAGAAEKVQDLLARGRGDIERYATLKLADAILRRGIERYRTAHQGPVLGRAGELFRTLTDGSFASLRIEDDEGLAVLQGVRPDGRAVGVEGMSDGSHDQLYLALRLAVLGSWLEAHGPVPFVADDILLTFDDRRASAALRALADFSSRTQVLMFTHHRHLIDLARAAIPDGTLRVQELPPAGSLANAAAGG
ncbi:MAG: AAA family ATPase [Isosphaeraceae bacterium]